LKEEDKKKQIFFCCKQWTSCSAPFLFRALAEFYNVSLTTKGNKLMKCFFHEVVASHFCQKAEIYADNSLLSKGNELVNCFFNEPVAVAYQTIPTVR
jgi:hypothetical protein